MRTVKYKTFYYIKIYKFEPQHFFMMYVFLFNLKKYKFKEFKILLWKKRRFRDAFDCAVGSCKNFHLNYKIILKNTIENPKFNFLTIIYEIRKKRIFAKLFVSIRSTYFVWHSF